MLRYYPLMKPSSSLTTSDPLIWASTTPALRSRSCPSSLCTQHHYVRWLAIEAMKCIVLQAERPSA